MKKSTRLLTLATYAATSLLAAADPVDRDLFVCDIPTAGCDKGMFNQALCECDCIKPFCPDSQGLCTVAGGGCADPWKDCERGVNCPWWVNPNKAEACTTGPNVPPGHWLIYNSESICCKANFPYSESCASAPATTPPTKHPTISRPEDDTYEAVPIKFVIDGVPSGVNEMDLRVEMLTVLKRVLIRLADRISDMSISSVEEKDVVTRGLMRTRHLEEVTFYYNVFVVRDDDKKFGPIIIQEMRDSYREILDQIQSFSDIKFFTGDISLNFCTFQNGKYDLCTQEAPKRPPARAPTPVVIQSDPGSEGDGLAGWVIAVIIILALIFVCCVGYAIAVMCFGVASCFGGRDERKEIHNNNIYFDDNSHASEYDDGYGGRSVRSQASGRRNKHLAIMDDRSRASSRRNKHLAIMDDRSRASRYDGENLAIMDDRHDDNLAIMDERSRASGYSRRTGRSRRSRRDDNGFEDDSFTINTRDTKQRLSRDPTMFIPGQEGKPDPGTDDVLMIADGDASSRRYYEDPPLKPKRDPTMYVEGNYASEDPPLKPKRDPTMYVEGGSEPSMYVEGGSEPSMYVEGGREPSMHVDGGREPSMYADGGREPSMHVDGGRESSMYAGSKKDRSMYEEDSVEEVYNDDTRIAELYGINEDEEYDQYGFKSVSHFSETADEEYARGRRDPTYYEDAASAAETFRTQEPSLAGSHGTSRSKKKSKKASRKVDKNKGDLRKSLQSNWGNSHPDMGGRSNENTEAQRQTKSFYN